VPRNQLAGLGSHDVCELCSKVGGSRNSIHIRGRLVLDQVVEIEI
jgi:hypothetical protein